jgi:hypothetical protein
VNLSWATSREENFDYFTVERSSDGRNFHELAIIFSKTTFSNSKKEYEFYDELPLPDYSFYRLKATDMDGYSEYHGIVSIRNEDMGARLRIYPNPSRGDQVNIHFSGIKPTRYVLMSIAGQVLQTGTLQQGLNEIHFSNQLSPGMYFIQAGEGMSAVPSKLIIR